MSETVRLATIVMLISGGNFAGGLVDDSARMLAVAAIALLATILVSSIVVAEPINSQFRRRPEGVVPPNAERLRQLWRRFHLLRTALGIAAYSLLVVAATYA